MIPAEFEYVRPSSVEAALSSLAEHGEDAKIIAGGHSLLPMMKLRLAAPAVLIDIARIPELSYIREDDGDIAIGAATRHADVVDSALLAERVPLLPYVANLVGDRQIRHRGTIGGSLVHSDPAADLPNAVLALGVRLVIAGASGLREVPVDEFFTGFFESAVGPDEILTEVRISDQAGRAGWALREVHPPRQRLGDRRGGRLRRPRLAGQHGTHAAARPGHRRRARVRPEHRRCGRPRRHRYRADPGHARHP